MRLVRIPVSDAVGRTVAHRHPVAGRTLAKGATVTSDDVDALLAGGVTELVVVELDPGDVPEDRAAHRIAEAAAGPGIRVGEVARGRAELVSGRSGVFAVDVAAIRALNAAHDAITLSTLDDGARVVAGELVGVVKIIPLAVPEDELRAGHEAVGGGALSVRAFRPAACGLVMTTLPHTREAVLAKTEATLRGRLEAMGSTLAHIRRTGHSERELAEGIRGLMEAGAMHLFVAGASSSMDLDDVLPAGVQAAGAELVRVGIPLEPGNQMLLARVGDRWVASVPACAASRDRTAFDVVLARILAGLPLDRAGLAELSVGGLLSGRATGRVTRPAGEGGRRVAGIVLAAGRSSRMGDEDKLLLDVGGRPMARRVVETALRAGLDPVVVVTGPDPDALRAVLEGVEGGSGSLVVRQNRDADQGMSGSLAVGIRALDATPVSAAIILLGDMPLVTAETVHALIEAFEPGAGVSACVPAHAGRRGNPVLWAEERFAALCALEGDVGARGLLRQLDAQVREVPVDDPGVLMDIDDPTALDRARDAASDSSGPNA